MGDKIDLKSFAKMPDGSLYRIPNEFREAMPQDLLKRVENIFNNTLVELTEISGQIYDEMVKSGATFKDLPLSEITSRDNFIRTAIKEYLIGLIEAWERMTPK